MIRAAAVKAGMTAQRDRWSPCPSCGSKSRAGETRFCVHITRNGWFCNACHAQGDALTIASFALGLDGDTKGRNYWRCKEWLGDAEGSSTEPPVDEPVVHARVDVTPALRRAIPLADVRDAALDAWLELRGLDRSCPAGWLPRFGAEWWPWYDGRYPVVVPACTAEGVVVSMHGLAITNVVSPSKVWPRGASSAGLLFADRKMRAWLSGGGPPPTTLLIAEGAPDYLTCASQVPTLGIVSGSESALAMLPKLPPSTKVYMGTHDDRKDGKGYRYEDKVADALAPHVVRRLPLAAVRWSAAA